MPKGTKMILTPSAIAASMTTITLEPQIIGTNAFSTNAFPAPLHTATLAWGAIPTEVPWA